MRETEAYNVEADACRALSADAGFWRRLGVLGGGSGAGMFYTRSGTRAWKASVRKMRRVEGRGEGGGREGAKRGCFVCICWWAADCGLRTGTAESAAGAMRKKGEDMDIRWML